METSSRQRVREEKDAADGCHNNDAGKQEQRRDGAEPALDHAVARQPEGGMDSTEHTECKLQLEAQRISLSQIHAAQLELLREQAAAHSHTLAQGQGQALLEDHKDTSGPEQPRVPPSQGPAGLQVELDRQRALLEERHQQEVELLRSSHRQQAEESEQRHARELMMLRLHLEEHPATQAHISLSSLPQLTSQREQEDQEQLKLLEEEEHQEEEGSQGAGLAWSGRSVGLTAQLQSLRRALYHKHTQEVSALREQHGEEVRRLGLQREQGGRTGAGEEEEEQQEERLNGEERRQQERVEEEIAKVIVQMSVEFAQQSELARLARRACQTSSAVQTQEEEEEEEEGPGQGAAREEVERRFRKQKENLEKELEEKNKELRRLMEQVERSRKRDEQRGEGRTEGEGDEEEGKKKRILGGRSHDGGESTFSDVIATERNLLRKANESLRQVLRDVLKTTAAAEETIGRHVEGLLEATSRGRHPEPQRPICQRPEPHRPYSTQAGDVSTESCHGSDTGTDDVSAWSGETDEGLEVSDGLLQGAELQNEEYLMNISARLQAAVEKLLVAITETTNQLEHARLTQTELMRESFRHSQEMEELLQRQEELQERLGEEARAREQLALELHRAEGLIDGYTGERAALDQQLRHKEELHQSLEQELQVTSSRLHELEQERLLAQQERELLSRQQDAMREVAGPRELYLLEETEKLMKEKVEVQRQAEKESLDLLKQVKLLEGDLEEQVNRCIELEHAHKTENGDLRQQIQALEKQLEKNRKFLDEQAVDREHERDVFQQEILKLEQQLKNPQKLLAGSEQRTREVDQLTSQLKQKADWCSELLLGSEQLQREVSERNEEIDKLEGRVRELEQALLASTETLDTAEKRQHVSVSEAEDSPLAAQLQTEREALDRKEKEIANLEEQLEQFREELENKSEEAHQLQMQLQIQRTEISTQQDSLDAKDNLIRVLEERDREIAVLNEQIAKLQHMETPSDNKELDQKDELIRELESQVECMRSERDRLKKNSEEELDQLNAVIDKLQEELANIEQNQAAAEEEEEEEDPPRPESQTGGPSKEEYEEMKQRVDLATLELTTLKTEHSSLLDTYRRLKESALALAETEKQDEGSELDLEDALREKTAAFLVMQAQVQALEQSATSRVEELSRRIQDLEGLVGERDSELARCRFLVEKAQEDAHDLQHKVSNLEDKLRDRVAATLVSQAQLGAVQQQSHATKNQGTDKTDVDTRVESQAAALDFGFPGIPRMDLRGGVAKRGPAGKVVLLTEKLRELEVGLSGMQKDQELQKQLLCSSEEEVLEYERRLATLMDLLNQMKPAGPLRTSLLAGASSTSETSVSNVLQELQEVREEAAVTRQQLSTFKESSSRLQEELKAKEIAIAKLQEDVQKGSSRGAEGAKMVEMQRELRSFKEEAAAAKEELSSCTERCDKLQELLQEREMTIAHLKGELHQAASEGLGPERSELLQELQEVREEAAATKEQLSCFRENTDKLQAELQGRDLSIAQLQEEVRTLGAALAKADMPPSPSPSPQPLSSTSSSSQPKKKGGKQGGRKGGDAKDKQALVRKSSAPSSSSSPSEKPRTPPLNNGSERPRSSTVDSTTQTEPSPAAEAEGVREVIGEYEEKIGQMLELHAAEILDMEARHIAESEALRREGQHVEEECKSLKAVIDKLCSSEAASSRPERPAASHPKDGYTSDSSSDWSQRTGYDLPNLQQEFRSTPEGARRETDDALPDRIKTLLREVHQEGMQVLSLSELPLGEGEAGPAGPHSQGWAREREALVGTVDSLKHLLTQMNRDTQTSGGADWRAELLGAVQQVFVRERSVLKSALYAQLDLLDSSDAIIHLNQLERRLAEQDSHHREAMGNLHAADRGSLLSEVRQLRAQLEHLQTPDPSLRGTPSLRDTPSLRNTPCLRNTPSQGVQSEAAVGRGVTQGEAGGPPEAPQGDGGVLEELRGELAQTRLELETTLKAQHKHLKELDMLRAEVTQKTSEVDSLTDSLSEEQKRSREQQWALEKERCKSDRRDATGREELEDLKLTVEDLQSQVSQLTSELEQERQASSQLSLQAQQEHLALHSRLEELQVQLEAERARAQELGSALGREKEMRRGGGPPQEEGEERSAEAVLDGLQRELDEKHAQVVRLLGEVETHKLEAVRRQEVLTSTGQRSQQDQDALQASRAQLQTLQENLQEAQAQLRKEAQRRTALEQEKERLEERVAQLGEEGETVGGGTQRADSQSPGVWPGEPTDRTRDWVFQQKSADPQTAISGTPSLQEPTGPGVTAPFDPRQGDKVLGKLQLIAGRIRVLASKAPNRLTTEVNREEITWLQSSVDEVISMLQRFPGLPPAPESAALLAGGSLTERLLRQNAELTGYVSRLTEEKNDLRNQTLRLEEEMRRYRHTGLSSGSRRTVGGVDTVGALFSQEREAWGRERSRLEKGLRAAQAELARLRGELRAEAFRDVSGPDADNTALKRMYGKYLRSESFRKALIYQKKYLLLLLGGFQECEEATLSLISRMGGRPSVCSLEAQRRRGLTRFRSAVRVSIALSRMRFLVKRWQKATGMSSVSSGTVNRNGLSQTPGSDVRDSPFLHPGSVEVFTDRQGATSRGRSGRDSPRSAMSSVQHRFHLAGDPAPLSCSHLQSYDPDRALTDYISRLEALQRRLGSVTSGSSSFAQLHFGMRR